MSKSANLWLVGKRGGGECAKAGPKRFWRDGFGRLTASTRVALPILLILLFVWVGWLYGNTRQAQGAALKTGLDASVPGPATGNNGKGASGGGVSLGAEAANTIQVDVHGDVKRPGVVTIPSNARVDDAIRAAGGFRDEADAMNVNSAALVWDGEELDVPGVQPVQARDAMPGQVADAQAEPPVSSSQPDNVANAPATSGKPLATDKIDLNTADEATLETLPGVGPKRAEDIVAYRQSHGPFHSVSDLLQVKGVGPKTLAIWAQNLYVSSTLPSTHR
ncbi:ComEA family DNA-binding protein [Alicyclobacillus fastidiosus]|uniref:ComEA family DNA-binding protein n=1 Tax=Alicyclobacillus fastidiosus TaxID=392011 RepID=A0ABV5ACI5_9BACL|nr:ComEA family DNA-binding protein [Alicyclobacillus fastidiosus]WEH11319.1 ComEA family DNA-binding protein [Alicyclobacillus fastidiosus]